MLYSCGEIWVIYNSVTWAVASTMAVLPGCANTHTVRILRCYCWLVFVFTCHDVVGCTQWNLSFKTTNKIRQLWFHKRGDPCSGTHKTEKCEGESFSNTVVLKRVVVGQQCGLSSGWFLIRMVFHKCAIIEEKEVIWSQQPPSRTGPSRWRGCKDYLLCQCRSPCCCVLYKLKMAVQFLTWKPRKTAVAAIQPW